MSAGMIGLFIGLFLGEVSGLMIGISIGIDEHRDCLLKAIKGLKADDTLTVELVREMLGGEDK